MWLGRSLIRGSLGLWWAIVGGRSGVHGRRAGELRRFPEIGREDLFGVFTLAPADIVFADPGRCRGPADRLGLRVALFWLPWPGIRA